MGRDYGVDPRYIDVGRLVERSVASLYSHLVTRPTGRAVRLAIESQLAESAAVSLSLIDLSEVRVLDFSCADEVVAKLLLQHLREDRPRDAFFVFRGVADLHRDPMEVVLERQSLAVVAETDRGRFELLGAHSEEELRVWERMEVAEWVPDGRVGRVFPDGDQRRTLEALVTRRLVFRSPGTGDYHALSTLIRDLI